MFRRSRVVAFWIVFSLVFLPLQAAADGWRATDSAIEYGLPLAQFLGSDDPSGGYKWFAPNAGYHDMWWYDYDNNGRNGRPPGDWVHDSYIRWDNTAVDEFWDETEWNLVHELRCHGRSLYEADSYFSSTLPFITHNDDSTELEELSDGYEEKEVGTLHPHFITPYYNYEVWTYWIPLRSGGGVFYSESELTARGFTDDWSPVNWREIGWMSFSMTR